VAKIKAKEEEYKRKQEEMAEKKDEFNKELERTK